MTEIETALQECLCDLEEGVASLDDCLKRYPEHAAQLRALLLAGAYLERAADVPVPAEFKVRVRARVMEGVHAHPRRPARSALPFIKLSASLIAAVLTLLASGTAYAQRALPGNAFYTWKLASERAWRTVSADPLETDLRITVRRADDLIAVSQDPALYPQALKTYLETTDKLKSEMNMQNEARILPLLDAQRKRLGQSGIHVPQAGQGIVPAEQPAQVSTAAPLPALPTVRPVATDAPQVFPTAKAPQILPTRKARPRVVPKIEVPRPSTNHFRVDGPEHFRNTSATLPQRLRNTYADPWSSLLSSFFILINLFPYNLFLSYLHNFEKICHSTQSSL